MVEGYTLGSYAIDASLRLGVYAITASCISHNHTILCSFIYSISGIVLLSMNKLTSGSYIIYYSEQAFMSYHHGALIDNYIFTYIPNWVKVNISDPWQLA